MDFTSNRISSLDLETGRGLGRVCWEDTGLWYFAGGTDLASQVYGQWKGQIIGSGCY